MKKQRIYKYPIATVPSIVAGEIFEAKVKFPKGAQFLSCQRQRSERDMLCMWAIVDPDEEEIEEKTFVIYGTGWTIMHDLNKMHHVCTLNIDDVFIYHVFLLDD
jgi:hypothetical protein